MAFNPDEEALINEAVAALELQQRKAEFAEYWRQQMACFQRDGTVNERLRYSYEIQRVLFQLPGKSTEVPPVPLPQGCVYPRAVPASREGRNHQSDIQRLNRELRSREERLVIELRNAWNYYDEDYYCARVHVPETGHPERLELTA